MNPQKQAKIPQSKIKYLILFNKESGSCLAVTKYTPNENNKKPCPTSPNIKPNKNGNETIVNKPGLISPYLGIP